MANYYYCEYCGGKFSSVSSLTASYCGRHPSGAHKGKHKWYEGGEKTQYVCKYCGNKFSSLSTLTANYCGRHPDGAHKGKHAPAL
jgi:DNA-directed RNA polymerase subunit RPC12/RpoP